MCDQEKNITSCDKRIRHHLMPTITFSGDLNMRIYALLHKAETGPKVFSFNHDLLFFLSLLIASSTFAVIYIGIGKATLLLIVT